MIDADWVRSHLPVVQHHRRAPGDAEGRAALIAEEAILLEELAPRDVPVLGPDGRPVLDQAGVPMFRRFAGGRITVGIADFLSHFAEAADGSYAALTAVDPGDVKGYRRYMGRWRGEGRI